MFDGANALDQEAFSRFVSTVGESLGAIWPEIILSVTICGVLLADLFLPRERSRSLAYLALGGSVLALFFLVLLPEGAKVLFSGMIALDSFSTFFKVVILLGAIVTVGLTWLDRANDGARMGEYYSLLLSAVLGMFLMAAATNMIMIYLAVELASLSSYALVGYRRQSRLGSEASLKYAVYGSMSSGLMLYGLSLLYGMTGSLAISSLAEAGARLSTDAGFALAILLVFAGLAYKMAAVPMHFWVPDVYQGAPTAVTAFLSVSSKAAGFAVFLRFMAALVPGREGLEALLLDWKSIVAVAAAVTMTVGNLSALFQTNIKRMLGYSSIAHAGYLLMGVAALDASDYAGFKAVAFYLVVYLFTNLGAFAVVILVSNQIGTEEIEGYRGLGSRMKLPAFAMAVFFFSLIGMPPTAGFTGKFLLFRAAIDENLYWLAMFGGVNTAVSVYYYFRVLKAMYLDGGDVAACATPPLLGRVLVALLAIPIFYLFFFGSVASWTQSLAFVGN